MTIEGTDVRFTARDDTVFALLRDPGPSVTLAAVAPTRTTDVTSIGGTALRWKATDGGIVVDLPADDPAPCAVVLHAVTAARRPH